MKITMENGQYYCWQWDTLQRLLVLGAESYAPEELICRLCIPKDKYGLLPVKLYIEDNHMFADIPDELLVAPRI